MIIDREIALAAPEILLPAKRFPLERWACVACDQFTSQPDYWRHTYAFAGDSPSALRLTLPEIFLSESETRIPEIHANMSEYLSRALETALTDGLVLVKRETLAGVRLGLVALFDLEAYDYSANSQSLIRATEGTVPERVPPRAAIRQDAPLELSHVMMLIDDPEMSVIEPLLDIELPSLYDFELMQNGGHIHGSAVTGKALKQVFKALRRLKQKSEGLLYAVGDGNHSLAAAKLCWENAKRRLSGDALETSPMRYAMAEIINLSSPALVFEPIHRALFNADPEDVRKAYLDFLKSQNAPVSEGADVIVISNAYRFGVESSQHPLRLLQMFLDKYVSEHENAKLDYIHGEEALMKLVADENAVGFMPRAFDKAELFPYIRNWGALPRKTFSMGEANDKRYYLEARKLF